MTNLKDLDLINRLSNERHTILERIKYIKSIEDRTRNPSIISVNVGGYVLVELGLAGESGRLVFTMAAQFANKELADLDAKLANLGVYPDESPPDESG